MESDCSTLLNADLDYSFHDIYVEFVKKEKQIEELTAQFETLNLERQNFECKFSKEIVYKLLKRNEIYILLCFCSTRIPLIFVLDLS